MSRTKTPPTKHSPTANGAAPPLDVMTLEEAAAYLRVTTEDVLRMIDAQGLPGRKFGSEWRFFRAALQSWLSNPPRKGLLKHAGRIKDDPYLEEMLKEIYVQRGRPETEEK